MKDSFVSGITKIIIAVIVGVSLWFSAREIRIGLEKDVVQRREQVVNQPNPTPPSLPSPQPTGDSSKFQVAYSPYEGKKNAPVTMIECLDYQCPFCARFAQDTLRQIKENEIKNGEVKLVIKNFPLPFHQNAEKAAEAAECANKQGKFWQMHDLLFNAGERLDMDSLKSYAKQIGLNSAQFDHCLESGETVGIVNADRSQCASAGVTGTPTFFINGKMLVGAQPYEQFKSFIGESR
ncbi:MAG: DsbA family protein [Deltaproteobacteria bacterium]|nr:DsbA family protein [Deltaproteobacteria bacterium]